jgi:hypothetical protein
MRLCKPPLFWNIFFVIHEAAEPQAINSTSRRAEAKLFQKYSRAATNFDRGVSIHGISSIKITFRLLAPALWMPAESISNASIHDAGVSPSVMPYFVESRYAVTRFSF